MIYSSAMDPLPVRGSNNYADLSPEADASALRTAVRTSLLCGRVTEGGSCKPGSVIVVCSFTLRILNSKLTFLF